jgi:hypothetical protein
VPKIKYTDINLSQLKLDIITAANRIITRYTTQGFSLTLRQLYYVFVSNDLFPDDWKYINVGNNKFKRDPRGTKNAPPNYDVLGDIISDGRMTGLIDWDSIIDRTRETMDNRHWDKPSSTIKEAYRRFAIDKWLDQPHYVEVWVEKEALEDILDRACRPLDVKFFACKGYTSQSAMWQASQRLLERKKAGKEVHVIHLGDHDPSGIDMSRDIFSRLTTFVGDKVHVQRIALNMSQVRRYNPPPNPAKVTDSRFAAYQAQYGDESWELDALNPPVLVELITRAVKQFRDEKIWDTAVEREVKGRRMLEKLYYNFPVVIAFLRDLKIDDTPPV